MKKLFIALLIILFSSTSWADSYEAKYNTAQWIPVVVLDSTDGTTAETGVLYTGVAFWYKEGISGTWTQLSLTSTSCTATSGYWCEESTANAPGSYRVYVPATALDTLGPFFYIVSGSGYRNYYGKLNVKTYTAAEESDKFPSSGTIPNTSTQMLVSNGTGTGQISLSSGLVTVGTNNDKTGYTASTVSDKTGYSLSQSFPTNFASQSIDSSGRVLLQPTQTGVTIPTVTTLTNAPSDSSGTTTLLGRVPDTISLAAINTEVDTALNTAIPGSPTADSINERVKAIDDKLPSATYIMGSAVATGKDDEVDAIKTKTDQLAFTVANQVDANALTGGGGATAADIWTYGSGRTITGGTVGTVTNAVTLPSIPTDWITNAGIAAGAITSSEAPNLDAAISSRASSAQSGLVATIDLTGNSGTWNLSLNGEGVSVTNQFKGMILTCGNESREIVASTSGSPDRIKTEPFNPWLSAPTSSTCTVRVK